MIARIETLSEKKLVGMRMTMSFAEDRTAVLWKSFMAQRTEIENRINEYFFSMQIYGPRFFEHFDPTQSFEKWAAVEVADWSECPESMESYTLPGGIYAVFLHRGAASTGRSTFEYIFQTWLPNSDYRLDERPHFELLGKKYKHEDSESEEEFWIPVISR